MANEHDEEQQQQQQQQQQTQKQPHQTAHNTSSSNKHSGDEAYNESNQTSDAGETQDCMSSFTATSDAIASDSVVYEEQTATATGTIGSCARGKLNDLLADLCLKVPLPVGVRTAGLGDYTNIRATTDFVEATTTQKLEPALPDLQSIATGASHACMSAASSSASTTHVQPTPPTQNATSSFSFKHFLSSSNNTTNSGHSATVTSVDVGTAPSTSTSNTSSTNATTVNHTNSNHSSSTQPSLQTSTGARPKVPQSASISTTSISSLIGGGGYLVSGTAADISAANGSSSFAASATKMKRSPRFSSFDSQASLAEYACSGTAEENDLEPRASGANKQGNITGISSSCSASTSGFRLCPDALGVESSDFFAQSSSSVSGSNHYERQHVPRSYSNYDMPIPTASPRRRLGGSYASKEARPNRLGLSSNSSSKLKLDLPIDHSSGGSGGCVTTSGIGNGSNNPVDFPAPAPSAAPAALPDFVQDHWLDSWYAHEMHLNSPPNSPICDYAEDLTGAAASVAANATSAAGSNGASTAAAAREAAVSGLSIGAPIGMSVGASEPPSTVKMLPDFLSDGPIIHSSQRLADVAVGLPSNSMGSPEDPPMSSQLSRLRMENERLQRELVESRIRSNEQTRRISELEQQLHERQRQDAAMNRSMSQNISLVEESLDKSKRRTAAAQTHVTKLKQQVTQLTTEVETLRRENESLREDGAVGGFSAASCDRSYPTVVTATAGAGAAAATASGSGSGSSNVRAAGTRPSKTQFSRDLLMAASNAEHNLRQLLAGVDNLRQMAADIENVDTHAYGVSPDCGYDVYSDFLDDCDDYEEYPSGGPAL